MRLPPHTALLGLAALSVALLCALASPAAASTGRCEDSCEPTCSAAGCCPTEHEQGSCPPTCDGCACCVSAVRAPATPVRTELSLGAAANRSVAVSRLQDRPPAQPDPREILVVPR